MSFREKLGNVRRGLGVELREVGSDLSAGARTTAKFSVFFAASWALGALSIDVGGYEADWVPGYDAPTFVQTGIGLVEIYYAARLYRYLADWSEELDYKGRK